MKKFKQINPTLFLFISFLTFSCTQESENTDFKNYPESIEVKQSDYDIFFSSWQEFSTNLDSDGNSILSNYLSSVHNENHKTSKNSKMDVDCGACSSCEASGTFSECCICCNGRAYACGVYFGIASCKCEDKAEDAKKDISEAIVILHPKDINKMLSFASMNGIDIEKPRKDLIKLIHLAI